MARFYVPKRRRFTPAIQTLFATACLLGAAFFGSSLLRARQPPPVPTHVVHIETTETSNQPPTDPPISLLNLDEPSTLAPLTLEPQEPPELVTRSLSALCPDGVPTSSEVANESIDLEWDCITPDIDAWLTMEGYTEEAVYATADALSGRSDVIALVRIEGNKLFFEDRDDDCQDNCNRQLEDITYTLRQALEEGNLNLPNCLFILNVDDEAVCEHDQHPEFSICSAPVLSINRRKARFKDILVPEFASETRRFSMPWDEKEPIAFFRGAPYCNDVEHYIGGEGGRKVNCSRLIISEYSQGHPDLLNVSITSDFDFLERKWDAVPGPDTPIEDHAKYQMLLNLDGYGASTRLAKLLPINSVVLKQESVFEEYYYRVLQPCMHYLPIWLHSEADVLDVVLGVRAEPQMAQAISANAQAFALTHLSKGARLKYWDNVLQHYAAMFPEGFKAELTTGTEDDISGNKDDISEDEVDSTEDEANSAVFEEDDFANEVKSSGFEDDSEKKIDSSENEDEDDFSEFNENEYDSTHI